MPKTKYEKWCAKIFATEVDYARFVPTTQSAWNAALKSVHNLIKYKCDECGQGNIWNGKPLILELDHKNGNPLDNRLYNLRYLCSNCHSQTDTNKGKNSKGIKKCKKN